MSKQIDDSACFTWGSERERVGGEGTEGRGRAAVDREGLLELESCQM